MNIFGIWLGDGPTTALSDHCIQTWGGDGTLVHDPEGDFAPWLAEIEYWRDAVAAKHWAAASDVARLALLYAHGGLYLDTDVEVCKPFRLYEAYRIWQREGLFVIGREDDRNLCGAVMCAPPKHPAVKRMLDVYRDTKFADTFDGKTNGTTLLTRHIGITTPNVMIKPPHIFYPWHWADSFSYEKKQLLKEGDGTLTAHHWQKQWSNQK